MISTTGAPGIAERFLELRDDDGSRLRGADPQDARPLPAELPYRLPSRWSTSSCAATCWSAHERRRSSRLRRRKCLGRWLRYRSPSITALNVALGRIAAPALTSHGW